MLPERSEPALLAAADMLGVDSITLRTRLLSRTVVSGRGSNYVIRYTVAAAVSSRDGLTHELYDRLFKSVAHHRSLVITNHSSRDGLTHELYDRLFKSVASDRNPRPSHTASRYAAQTLLGSIMAVRCECRPANESD